MPYFILALFWVALDQATKYYVASHFQVGESVPVIQNIFHWTYVLNPGAAFGIFEGQRWIFIIIALGVMFCLWYLREEIIAGGLWMKLGSALFGAGALGNVIDRARQGLVIDFFDFRIWPVFNVADIGICVGVAMIVWSILLQEREEA